MSKRPAPLEDRMLDTISTIQVVDTRDAEQAAREAHADALAYGRPHIEARHAYTVALLAALRREGPEGQLSGQTLRAAS